MDLSSYTASLPFILFFLLAALLIGTVAGEKILYGFLLLVLASMLILNAGKVQKLFTKFY